MKKGKPEITDEVATAGLLRRLNNVRGQIDGVARMVERKEDCLSVLTQFKAARAGLDRSLTIFLESHLKQCIGIDDLPRQKKLEVEGILSELTK
jgi:DNA-binding FrmR family transcriptional regulator